MSDSEQDVTKGVVSPTLPCRFPPVSLNVNNFNQNESAASITSYPNDNTPKGTEQSNVFNFGEESDSTLNTNKSKSGLSTTKIAKESIADGIFDSKLKSDECEEHSEHNQNISDRIAIITKDISSVYPVISEYETQEQPTFNACTTSCIFSSSSTAGTKSVSSVKEQIESACRSSLLDISLGESFNSDYDLQEFEKESNLSGSATDATLQNSDASTEAENSSLSARQDFSKSETRTEEAMGNKQPKPSQKHSDDDTPDDGRTKCCEIPKKKVKERSGRGNRTSRNDDLNFESDEVYPFDGRTRSEQDINEPVELEPFEIVETDDIKFVPGAGTSEVIKSVSEPKFTPIAEEPCLPEDDEDVSPDQAEETNVKTPFFIEKGNRILEPGTATAHSTFEFRQVKPKVKLNKSKSDDQQHNYENISMEESRKESYAIGRKTSSSSSKSSSSSSSKNVSRKNSKDAITKPARKRKSKPTSAIEESSSVVNEKEKDEDKGQKQPSVRDSEIDRNIDNVLMLTQTMFSQTKVTDDKDLSENLTQSEPVALTQYENVNVCAKLEPSGIKITNTGKTPRAELITPTNKDNAKSETQCERNACEKQGSDVKEKTNRRKNYPQLSKDIVEISESGTLIIKSLADMPSAATSENDDIEQCDSNGDDGFDENTDVKAPYDTIDRIAPEERKDTLEIGKPNKCDDKEVVSAKEHVPPPSPQMMVVLEEEEEDIVEDIDETDIIEENRRKSEILEFTEDVCKRLSLLLEGGPVEEENVSHNEHVKSQDENQRKYEDHIYETIDGSYRIVDMNYSNTDALSSMQDNRVADHNEIDSDTTGNRLTLSTRSESSSTLKRISGDSETYRTLEARKSSQSDDDELPDYFDPRDIPPPKRDSEILYDVLDSYSDDVIDVDEVPADKVAEVVKSNRLALEGLSTDNIDQQNRHKGISVKSFEMGVMNDTPSTNVTEDLCDITPTVEAKPNLTALPELAKAEEETPVQFDTSGRQSATCTESDIDISEHRDDLSTDSMLADDEAEETMEILFTKTYTEPVEGAEVFLSCTVVNSAYKDEQKKSETWLSDEALEYLEANASEVMSTAFLKAKKEMKDIQICLQSLRQQMEHFHSDCDDISLPEIPVDSLSPDYFGIPMRKAVTD